MKIRNVLNRGRDLTPEERLRLRRRRIWWRIQLQELAAALELTPAALLNWELGRGRKPNKHYPRLRSYDIDAWLKNLDRLIEARRLVRDEEDV